MAQNDSPKVAILDMNDNHPNQGIRCIKDLIVQEGLEYELFDTRYKNEFPNPEDFDIYISSGGPGDPIECMDTPWGRNFGSLMDFIYDHNRSSEVSRKHAFMICHSFQMLVLHWKMALINKRRSTSFGILPCHKTERSHFEEPFLDGLTDPFYVVDSRDFQIVQPDYHLLNERGSHIVCLEKIRDHLPYERAIMAIRFTDEIFGTQFHPEADEKSMKYYLYSEEKKEMIIERHGEKKYFEMLSLIDNPKSVKATNAKILPTFLRTAVAQHHQVY